MKAITANRLSDGAVVYLGDDEAALTAAQGRKTEIADAYLITVSEDGALSGRERLRETIRTAGPTVRLDLGYQAGG